MITTQHDLGVEHGKQAFEISLTRRCKEGVDDGPLAIKIDVRHGRTLEAATGTARELPRRWQGRSLCRLVFYSI